MALLLDVLYVLCLVAMSPYVLWKMVTTEKYRAGLRERFGRLAPRPGAAAGRPCVWIHGVSVGEVLASKPLVSEIERAFPDHDIAISSTTSTGVRVAAEQFPKHRVLYYPVDLSLAVSRAIRAIRPSVIVLVELELWPNFLHRAFVEGVPIVLVNGRISDRSFRGYLWIERLLFRPLQKIRFFCVQTDEYAKRFLALGVPREQVLVTGNMKYDNLPIPGTLDVEALSAEYRARLRIAPGAPVLVAGSTHPPEEKLLLGVYQRLRRDRPGLRLVIVPRHLERLQDVIADVKASGQPYALKTELDAAAGNGRRFASAVSSTSTSTSLSAGTEPVIIVDTRGELARLYACATVVFVGGSLIAHGGQNMLEPAGLGKPVLFGPHVFNFTEAKEMLLRAGGAEAVSDAAGLEAAVRRLLADPAETVELGRRGREAVLASRGAAARNVEVLKRVVEGAEESRRARLRAGAAGSRARPAGLKRAKARIA